MTKFSFITLALLTGVGGAIAACSSSGDDSTATGGSGGSGGKAGSSSTAGKGGSSTAGKGGTAAVGEAGAGGAGSSSLYDRLGGNDGITMAIAAIVAAEVKDPDIASYFSQSADPAYMPSVTDIEECFVLLLDNASGGGQKYLGVKVTSGFACESMAVAHADLGINSGTFDKFVTIAAGVLAAKPFSVSADDLGTIGTVLVGTKSDIVTDTTTTAEKPCTAPAACAAAAGAGGAG